MRTISTKIFGLCVAIAMVIAISGTALAARTMEILGAETDVPQISITNAANAYSKDVYLEGIPTLDAGAPATITLIGDGDFVEAYELVKKDGKWAYVTEIVDGIESKKMLPIKGNVSILDGEKEVIVDAADPRVLTTEFPSYQKGCTITLDKPGRYYFSVLNQTYLPLAGDIPGSVNLVINVTEEMPVDPPIAPPAPVTATPTASKVLVDGTAVAFDAYNIADNNYFKLRDVAKAISGSQKQFDVSWDEGKNAINLLSNKAYTEVGGELAKGDALVKNATATTSAIYKDAEAVTLTAYNIADNNYFKLRDLGEAFGFDVSWDGENNAIMIDTTKAYTAD